MKLRFAINLLPPTVTRCRQIGLRCIQLRFAFSPVMFYPLTCSERAARPQIKLFDKLIKSQSEGLIALHAAQQFLTFAAVTTNDQFKPIFGAESNRFITQPLGGDT